MKNKLFTKLTILNLLFLLLPTLALGLQPYQDPSFDPIPQGPAQCGPTSLYMVFNFYRDHGLFTDKKNQQQIDLSEKPSRVTSKTTFCKWVNRGKDKGTSWSQMKYAIKDLLKNNQRYYAVEINDRTTSYRGKKALRERLERFGYIVENYLNQNRPVIIHMRRSSYLPGHYLVVIGFDQENQMVYYADPNKGHIDGIGYQDFIAEKWYISPTNTAKWYNAYWDGEWLGFFHTDPKQIIKYDSPGERIIDRLDAEKAIIVTADDLGKNLPVNQGIVETYLNGVVTNVNLQSPTLFASQAVELLQSYPRVPVGIHLTLNRTPEHKYGPLVGANKAPSLVDRNGLFHTNFFHALLVGKRDEIKAELRAQIEFARERQLDISHIDCHMGWCYGDDPDAQEPFLELAKEYNLPVRWIWGAYDAKLKKRGLLSPDKVVIMGVKATKNDYQKRKQNIINHINALKRGKILEFVFHPQAGEPGPKQVFRHLDYLLSFDPDIMALLKKQNIALISYRELRDMQRLVLQELGEK